MQLKISLMKISSFIFNIYCFHDQVIILIYKNTLYDISRIYMMIFIELKQKKEINYKFDLFLKKYKTFFFKF
jgi:hypothetical protein